MAILNIGEKVHLFSYSFATSLNSTANVLAGKAYKSHIFHVNEL